MEIKYSEISPEEQALTDEIKSFIRECTTIPKATKIIYQYTNIDALFNGIVVKEPKKEGEEICLWASNYMYMNDPNEIATGQKYVDEVLDEYFLEDNNTDVKEIQELEDLNYYITSFSKTKDSLPMWGMYGKNGAGIALGFDRMIIENTNTDLYQCAYIDEELKSQVKSFCEKVKGEKISKETLSGIILLGILTFSQNKDKKQTEDIINNFLFMIYAKDPAYKYEDEVRLLIHSDANTKIEYRTQSNLIIPYIENLFPKEALKEVWIGPTTDMKRTIKSVKTYLDYKGFTHVDIIPSEVPYRG